MMLAAVLLTGMEDAARARANDADDARDCQSRGARCCQSQGMPRMFQVM